MGSVHGKLDYINATTRRQEGREYKTHGEQNTK